MSAAIVLAILYVGIGASLVGSNYRCYQDGTIYDWRWAKARIFVHVVLWPLVLLKAIITP